jgi:hypothetical protein
MELRRKWRYKYPMNFDYKSLAALVCLMVIQAGRGYK